LGRWFRLVSFLAMPLTARNGKTTYWKANCRSLFYVQPRQVPVQLDAADVEASSGTEASTAPTTAGSPTAAPWCHVTCRCGKVIGDP